MTLTNSFLYLLLWIQVTTHHIPLSMYIITYVLSLSMPEIKCAGRGDSKYKLSNASLVPCHQDDCIQKPYEKLIVHRNTRNTIPHEYFLYVLLLMSIQLTLSTPRQVHS